MNLFAPTTLALSLPFFPPFLQHTLAVWYFTRRNGRYVLHTFLRSLPVRQFVPLQHSDMMSSFLEVFWPPSGEAKGHHCCFFSLGQVIFPFLVTRYKPQQSLKTFAVVCDAHHHHHHDLIPHSPPPTAPPLQSSCILDHYRGDYPHAHIVADHFKVVSFLTQKHCSSTHTSRT